MRTFVRALAPSLLLVVVACSAGTPDEPLVKSRGTGRPVDEIERATEAEAEGDIAPLGGESDVVVTMQPDTSGQTSESEALAPQAIVGGVATIVYVNGDGRTLTHAKRDDSAAGLSAILPPNVGTRTFPASNFKAGGQWASMMDLVREDLAPYNVDVVDQRPAAGPYIEIVVTAAGPSSVGLGQGVGGVAMMAKCGSVATAVGYAFETPSLQKASPATEIARIVTHEAGHALGLAHTQTPDDTMSYNFPSTRAHTFQDVEAQCGVTSSAPEDCACNEARQNNYRTLLKFHGPRSGSGPTPNPPTPGRDTTAPTVTLVAPAAGATFAEGSTITVEAQATDDVGVKEMQLYWAFNQRLVGCAPNDPSFPCVRSGDRATWSLQPGTGPRDFYVVAVDAAGNRGQSATRTITIGSGPPPSTVDAKPTVAPVSPTDNQILTRGGPLKVEARVADDKGVRRASAFWIFPSPTGNKVMEYELVQTAPGVYSTSTVIAPTAVRGDRAIVVRAEDTAGQRTDSAPIFLSVQ